MITSPYNFVPLNHEVYIPEWYKVVSQDIPFEDGEDGWIEVTWSNASPLFIRDSNERKYSMHVLDASGQRHYFIPGSSMKGMLRNVLSILSFGKMEQNQQYYNRSFGYRNVNNNGGEYKAKIGKAKFGWLKQLSEDVFQLSPCKENVDTISIDEVKKNYPDFNGKITAWDRNQSIKDNTFPVLKGHEGYRLFCTGKMDKKLHELLIPEATDEPIGVSLDVINSFRTVYSQTEGFDKYMGMLQKGEQIPVSFIADNKANVSVIGMGLMFKVPYEKDIRTLVEQEQRRVEGRDLCETIFGWTGNNDSMRGRAQIGHAFAVAPLSDDQLLPEVNGVLGEPKASFFPLYLKQESDSGKYKNYNTAAGIAGRKRYRIHKSNEPKRLPQGNQNENMTKGNEFKAIPAGQRYVMRINVHNLRKIEIGAILAAITLNHTNGVWHNIGLAKSFGYGKIACDKIVLHGLNYTEQDYLKAFEYEMSEFANKTGIGEWNQSEQVRMLMAVMSGHQDAEVRMMDMAKKEYQRYKNNKEFSLLSEQLRPMNSSLTVEDRNTFKKLKEQEAKANKKLKLKDEMREKYDHVKCLVSDHNYSEAIKLLNEIINKLVVAQVSYEEENQRLQKIKDKRTQQELEAKKQEEAEQQNKRDKLLKGGLGKMLEEQKNDKYLVSTWKMCNSKVESWLKKSKATILTDEDKICLENTIRRIYANPDKNERKDWKKACSKSYIWKKISKYLGEARSEELYNELNS